MVKKWKLDSGNDGHDEILIGTREEVLKDVLHHHELDELPEHWKLIEIDWEKGELTAREFLEKCGYEVTEKNLVALTRYTDSSIDFSQFPDAFIPEELSGDAEAEAHFQEYMDHREEEIYEVTDASGDIWEVTDVDSVPCWVRRKGTEEWQEVTWHIFCQNHGIDPDCLA